MEQWSAVVGFVVVRRRMERWRGFILVDGMLWQGTGLVDAWGAFFVRVGWARAKVRIDRLATAST
jgi:hypothetical protein